MLRAVAVVIAIAGFTAAPARAQQVTLPANDLNPVLALVGIETPIAAPVQSNPEPPLRPVPRADCGPGSRPLEGEQGRVPASAINSPQAADGWTCNLTPVGHRGGAGGWKVWRYVDRNGHECAYYDTALMHLLALTVPGLPSTGVAVLDMSDPSRPVQTDLLDTLPMQGPHESLNLNERRGLLAAAYGTGMTGPGLMSIYDVSEDCRHPVHKATTAGATFGHESGFSPDGRTFWIAGGIGLAAIDVSDPRFPRKLWEGSATTHGLSLSEDGNRAYLADPINGHLVILDVSDVQARKPDPKVRELSRLTWKTVSIPQNTAPMLIDGKRYVLEFDEFAFRFNALPQDLQQVGAARIVDIADEKRPRVISNLRLSINQPDRHAAASMDPGALSPVQSYAAHYCAIPREIDPEIVACSFINSGLRIFDIRDPEHPREAGYYIAPPKAGVTTGGTKSNFALSKPAFAPGRREVWYTDVISGFHAVRLSERIWPQAAPVACASRRTIVIHLDKRLRGLRRFRVTIAGKRVPVRRVGRNAVRVSLKKRPKGRFTVVVRAVTRSGRRVQTRRHYRTCTPRPR